MSRVLATAVRAAAAAALLALLVPSAARAGGEFGTNNVQLLQGWTFDDTNLGYNTPSGNMTTVTANFFATWKYGDNFAFADLYRGNFGPGLQSTVYTEWHPRLFINKLAGQGEGQGFIKNWGLAGEINMSSGFYAYLGGVGADFNIPGFVVAGLNVYYRYDNFNNGTWQVSPFWTVPFKVVSTDWLLTGFVDVMGTREKHIDVMAQPELLLDIGAFAGSPGKLHAGVEWYLHYNKDKFGVANKNNLTSAPQAMIQWTTF